MQGEPNRFDELISLTRNMSSADRKAVLHRLPIEQRHSVEQLLKQKNMGEEEQQDEAPPASKRYALFSPVLARMLGEIDEGKQPRQRNNAPLTKAACKALADAAKEIGDAAAEEKAHKEPSLPKVLRSFFAGLGIG